MYVVAAEVEEDDGHRPDIIRRRLLLRPEWEERGGKRGRRGREGGRQGEGEGGERERESVRERREEGGGGKREGQKTGHFL